MVIKNEKDFKVLVNRAKGIISVTSILAMLVLLILLLTL
jgi:hypothetical protein